MATFVFENMTQAQANAITSGDIIAVSTPAASAGNIGVSISAATDTIQNTTLTVGSKSLFFDASALSSIAEAGNIVFNDGSSLDVGLNTGTTDATGSSVAYLFAGADTYTGAAAGSTIYGAEGDDTITAGAGPSNLFGGAGADSLVGGAGNDHLYGQSASGGTDGADSIAAGDGADYVNGNKGADTIDGEAGSDRLLGGADNDSIDGSAGNDSVNGNLGNDTINGGADDDFLRGGQGNDVVSGGAGNDILLGDLGADTLDGNTGVDFLTGGAGNDVFLFTAGEGNIGVGSTTKSYDTIIDFVDGEDTIDLGDFGDAAASAEINIGSSGATFTTVSAAKDYAQQLLDANTQANDIAIVKVGGDSYIFYASTGANLDTIDTVIKIQGVTDTSLFTSADFV